MHVHSGRRLGDGDNTRRDLVHAQTHRTRTTPPPPTASHSHTPSHTCLSQVNAIANVTLQQKKQRLDTTSFRLAMEGYPVQREGDGVLYALYGDPQELERGGHPYWLIAVTRNPYQAPKGLKCAQGNTIAVKKWIVNARWYSCTSDDSNHKAYTLLSVPPAPLPQGHAPNASPPPCICGQESSHVHVRLSSFVTETGLEWARYQQGRTADRPSTGLFSDVGHLAVMRHNFSNVI
jgi:hypothetical protein